MTPLRLYRPANGSEAGEFDRKWCDRCKADKAWREYADGVADEPVGAGCPILVNALINDVDDPDYPREWNYGPDGTPRCTAFEEVT